MKLVIQRVKESSVKIDGEIVGAIERGLLVLLGIGKDDSEETVSKMVAKLIELRIFEDDKGKMNFAALEAGAEFLVVSQFTLYGDCSKGRRPSFDAAADPVLANHLYESFVNELRQKRFKVETGRFAAKMDVALINDGPVTFVLES